MTFEQDPIMNVKWLSVDELDSNQYNPNVVFNRELKLLEFSILQNGWIQPILVNSNHVIIDGFHRWSLSRDSAKLRKKYKGLIPCCVMELEDWEAMLLTVRINRAKGHHAAVRMADLVKQVVDEYGIDLKTVAKHIGSAPGEAELLYQDSIFKAKNLDKIKYNKAWVPRESRESQSLPKS